MIIRKLVAGDTQSFCDLIVNMYSDLENLEWFSPMPYDYDNVKSMIENPRFFIVGVFENETLCAVSSFDYKCGKLIGKIDFPAECNTEKLVEIGFTMVHSKFKGQGIMKTMVEFLVKKAHDDGFEWVFSKVHKDNFASSKSFQRKGFNIYCHYVKPINKKDFISLSSQEFFSKTGKENAKSTLDKFAGDEEIVVDYNILIKDLR